MRLTLYFQKRPRVGLYNHTYTWEAPSSQITWRRYSEDCESRDQLKKHTTVSCPPPFPLHALSEGALSSNAKYFSPLKYLTIHVEAKWLGPLPKEVALLRSPANNTLGPFHLNLIISDLDHQYCGSTVIPRHGPLPAFSMFQSSQSIGCLVILSTVHQLQQSLFPTNNRLFRINYLQCLRTGIAQSV
jgi:hypothetical protein